MFNVQLEFDVEYLMANECPGFININIDWYTWSGSEGPWQLYFDLIWILNTKGLCSFTHFLSPKLKFHNFKKKVKDSWNHDESNCGEGYHHNEVIM